MSASAIGAANASAASGSEYPIQCAVHPQAILWLPSRGAGWRCEMCDPVPPKTWPADQCHPDYAQSAAPASESPYPTEIPVSTGNSTEALAEEETLASESENGSLEGEHCGFSDTGGSEKIGAAEIFDHNGALWGMLEDYRAGRLTSDFEVRLEVTMAKNAHMLRSLARQIEIVMGLSLTMGEVRAPMISCSFAAWLMGWDPERGSRRASGALKALADAKVIRRDGLMPPMEDMAEGTHRWQPYDFDVASLFEVEADPIAAGELEFTSDAQSMPMPSNSDHTKRSSVFDDGANAMFDLELQR